MAIKDDFDCFQNFPQNSFYFLRIILIMVMATYKWSQKYKNLISFKPALFNNLYSTFVNVENKFFFVDIRPRVPLYFKSNIKNAVQN